MYELKKIGKVLTSKSVGTGPSPYEKRIYRAAVSQIIELQSLNPLTPNDLYISRATTLTSKRCILYIYSANVRRY